VYCEKPLAHSVEEARLMQEEAEKRRGEIATQMGTQIHAEANYRRVVELVQGGAIGVVSEAHVWCDRGINPVGEAVLPEEAIPDGFDWEAWIGPAEMRPYNGGYWQGGNLNWNRRWNFGGGVLGDMGSHLIDLPYWALGLDRPKSVESEGPEPDLVACPPWQVVTWEHPAREGNASWAVPTKLVWYHGAEGMLRRAELLQPMVGEDTRIDDWGIGVAFVGSEGVLVADYGKLVLSPGVQFADYERPAESIPPSMGHYLEWIHAAKTGGEALCEFGYSGSLIEHNLLGNVAHRLGKRLEWDGETLSVPGVPEADSLIRKSYRVGWGV
jgi:predicted dehydrogenase